ncbi:hypothetical protein [Nocardia vaccinii]|uniref:hypothetical protein n=1 Tax=Nocardia vaccinii TaxID=1822 RepID=UPI0012F4D1FB|nr:hypothetical protein [Nocardia vaccinii]
MGCPAETVFDRFESALEIVVPVPAPEQDLRTPLFGTSSDLFADSFIILKNAGVGDHDIGAKPAEPEPEGIAEWSDISTEHPECTIIRAGRQEAANLPPTCGLVEDQSAGSGDRRIDIAPEHIQLQWPRMAPLRPETGM